MNNDISKETYSDAYQNYIGIIQFDEQRGCYIGQVKNCSDKIMCRGYSVTAAKHAFGICVDAYLELCKQKGVKPKLLKTTH